MTTMVSKVDGTKEVYNEDKIRRSASRVGVPQNVQDMMLEHIRGRLYDGIPTHEIFEMIKEFLHTSSVPHLAMKYNLKAALSELGPSGYPFEQYLALLLAAVGYTTMTNQTIQGSCVSHEVDVLAIKDNVTYFIEAKFHKSPSQSADVKIALYIKARYDDLKSAWTKGETRPWIITNTRFSTDAITYSDCQNIRLMSWGYPKGKGLVDLIEETGLHPITILDNLTQTDKVRLLTAGIVTCQQLMRPENQEYIPQSLRQEVVTHLKHLYPNK